MLINILCEEKSRAVVSQLRTYDEKQQILNIQDIQMCNTELKKKEGPSIVA